MATFLVVLHRDGPQWVPSRAAEEQTDWQAHASLMDQWVDEGFIILGGPLADEIWVVVAVEAMSEEAVLTKLARDPWSQTHLLVQSVDRWMIRLGGERS